MKFIRKVGIVFAVPVDGTFHGSTIILAGITFFDMFSDGSALFGVNIFFQVLADVKHHILAFHFFKFHFLKASDISFLKKALALWSLDFTAGTDKPVIPAVSSVESC